MQSMKPEMEAKIRSELALKEQLTSTRNLKRGGARIVTIRRSTLAAETPTPLPLGFGVASHASPDASRRMVNSNTING